MNCDTCGNWILSRVTVYDDGSEVANYQAPDGVGHCQSLNIDTQPNFGCTGYAPGSHHHVTTKKAGAPWHHWKMGPCPDCTGKGNQGDGACDRCTGTGNVRYYDDGFVGEERSRMHPKEKELAAKPKCVGCGREVDPVWVACPMCGQKLDAPMQPEKIDDPLFTGQAL